MLGQYLLQYSGLGDFDSTYIAGTIVVASTAWVAYYTSVRRWGLGRAIPDQNTIGTIAEDHEATTRQSEKREQGIERESAVRKAPLKAAEISIPSFTLDDSQRAEDGDATPTAIEAPSALKLNPPQPPSSNTIMPPPPRPSNLMAPPQAPPRLKPPSFSSAPSTRMAPPPRPSNASSLRPPPSAAAGLRVPPRPAATSSTLPSSRPSSRSVTLTPGHSPLDWASLTNNPSSIAHLRGRDATRLSITLFSSPYTPLPIPPTTLRRFTGRRSRDAWTSYNGRIYNITPYLPFHPGGEKELLKGAGRGSEKLFAEVHPWVNWEGMLKECCIGVLVGEDDDRAIRVNADAQVVGVGSGTGPVLGAGEQNPLDEMD